MSLSEQVSFTGWDIGGAHLKIARTDAKGGLQQVIQLPCALWRGIEELESALKMALQQLGNTTDYHFITMTGELVDAFENRQQGVKKILACVTEVLPETKTRVFADQGQWLNSHQAAIQWARVASMNWQASAMLAAQHTRQGLFIDIGSTTCDIIPIVEHQIKPQGLTDHLRQRYGELVYTGAIRTPVMAYADAAPMHGDWVPLTAEWFASSGDVWCLLDQLDPAQIQDDSADRQPWRKPYCQQRLARMLATDAEMVSEAAWLTVANWFAEKQIMQVLRACYQVLSQHSAIAADSPLIGAGVGRFIVKHCADRLNRPFIDYGEFCNHVSGAAEHAPASALALLARHQLT